MTLLRTSCLLLEFDGVRALTDPWFGTGMRFLPVFRKPGIALTDLPKIDYVFASHLHPDHFDPAAVARFGHPGLQIVGPVGTATACRGLGVGPVHELSPWQRVELAPFRLRATPALHTGPPPAEINFVIEVGGLVVFFGGDCRFSSAFEEVREQHGPVDLALLPIGGTLIFGHRTTMGPADAARASSILGARWTIPIHEGGEWMPVPPASWHPGRNRHFVRALRRRGGGGTEAVVLGRGQSALFSPDRTPVEPVPPRGRR